MTLSNFILYIMAGVAGITLLIGFFCGLKRGTLRSILRTAMLVGCAVGAYALAHWAIVTYEAQIETIVMPLIQSKVEALAELFSASDTLAVYIVDILCALVAPIAYLIIFYTLKFLTWIVYLIISAIIPKPKKKAKGKKKAQAEAGGEEGGKKPEEVKRGYSGLSRILGAGVSMVGAAVIVVSLFMPIAGYLEYASEIYPKMEETGLITSSEEAKFDAETEINAASSNVVMTTIRKTGGKYLFDRLTQLGDTDATVKHEMDVILDMIPAVQKLGQIDFSSIFDSGETPDLSPIDEGLLPVLEESDWMQQILSEIMSTAAIKWQNGETFMGINIKEQLPEEHAGALDGVLNRLATTTQDRVVSDLHDLTDTVKLVSEAFTYMNDVANVGNVTTEQLQEQMQDILMNLTPGSAELLGSALSDEMVGAAGLTEESSTTVKEMITSALNSIANQTEEERVAEGNAINALISYTSEDRRDNVTADEIVDTLLSSSVVKDVITEQITPDEEGNVGQITVTEEQKTAIDTVIEAKKAEALENADEETLAFLESLSGFFTLPGMN